MSTLRVSLMGLSSRLVATGLMVASTLMLARRLDLEGTGQYFLFLRVVALLAVFADLGFSQSATVFASRGESPRQLHGLLVRVSICSSVPVLLVFMGVMKLFGSVILPNYPQHLQVATIVALPFFVYASFWTYMMVGLAQIWKMNLVQIAAAAATLLLVIIFIFGLSMGLRAAVAIYTGTLMTQALVMAVIAGSIARSSAEARSGLFPEMLRFSLRGAGGAIAALIWPRIPVFLLNVLHGPSAVGLFSVVQQLVEKMLLPMQAVQDAIYRQMAQLTPAGAKAAMNRYVRISGWLMGIFLLIAGALLPMAIVFVLGPRYAGAMPVVMALIPGAVVMSTAYLLSTFFLAHLGKPGLMSILAGGAFCIIALLSVALIPPFGATGAALAVAGTQIIATSIVVTIYLRTTGARFLELVRVDRADRDLFRRQIRHLALAGRPLE